MKINQTEIITESSPDETTSLGPNLTESTQGNPL